MALTFLYGNSGNGKSEYMYRMIADMAEHAPYQHYFLVVPEQFTLSAQKSLVGHTDSGVILNVDVVSFDRLAYRVFDELGVHRAVMGETGKSLVLRRIVEQNESNLTILRRNLTKMGYIGELKSVLSELMQYDISPDDLEEFIGKLSESSSLAYKLRDILSVYRSFDDYLQGEYVTAERVLDLFADVAEDSEILCGSVLFFDGFTGFTPVQMKLMRRLMHLVSDIYVTVTLDTSEELYVPARIEDLFYMSHKMVNTLARAAREASFEIADPIRIDPHEGSRFCDNPALAHLERNLFRSSSRVSEMTAGDHLKLYSLLSPREELRFAAASIRSLVREKGCRYRDFAIVCSDVNIYEMYADSIFSQFDIPLFLDTKRSILYHPLTELIRSVCEMARNDCSQESVFRYLRTNLCGFSVREVDALENYCLEKGIRGMGKWKNRFTSPPAQHGRIRPDEERTQEELADLNRIREGFVAQTENILALLKKRDVTVRERTQALYDLLCGLSVEEQLREESERFDRSGDELSADVNRQIYRIVIDLMDKMVDLLGDDVIPLSDYEQILEAGFASARVGTIPPGNDCVILGDIERTRLDQVKVLFFLGVNDGSIPRKSGRQSILSQYDREMLDAMDMELSPGEREQVFLQRFYLYLAMTKPQDALILTCRRMDGSGKAERPSYLFGVLEKLYADLVVNEIDPQEMTPTVTAKSSVESYLSGLKASDSGEYDARWGALHRWYMGQDAWRERIAGLFDAHFAIRQNDRLSPDLARALYGSVLYNSVTRLEKFEECAFAHFLEFGLKLAERRELSFTSPDMGTFIHLALENYGRRLDQASGWRDVTEEQREEILGKAMEETALALPNEFLTESASGAYTFERIYRILRRSVWAISEQIKRGDFHPEEYEVEFPDRELPGSEIPMRLTGRIDRMDTCVDEGSVEFYVVDYKSGSTTLDLSSVYYGRQLQLPVYLDTAMELLTEKYPGREIVPAGIFYFHVDDPMVAETSDVASNQSAILKKLRPDGCVNSDPYVFLRIDRGLYETKSSDVLSIKLKKDGSVYSNAKNMLSSKDFILLAGYVRQVMQEASRDIMEGEIAVNPYRMEKSTGCDYCEFKGICGIDFKIPGYGFREEKKIPEKEIIERIRARAADAGNENDDVRGQRIERTTE